MKTGLYRILTGFLVALAMVAGFAIFSRTPAGRATLYDFMFAACSENSVPRARFWMLMGASPDGQSDYEVGAGHNGTEFSSHVHIAALKPDCRLLRLLLSKGASPNLELGDGTTPLDVAGSEHNIEAVKLLLAAGARVRHPEDWKDTDRLKKLGLGDLIPLVQPYLK